MSVHLMGSKARVGSKFYKKVQFQDCFKVKVLFEKLSPICDLDDFIKEAERLSSLAGIPTSTVAKKIPPKDTKALYDKTYETWCKSQRLCREANVAFNVTVDPWKDPQHYLDEVRVPDALKEHLWGLRYLFQMLMEPYKRTKGVFMGPGMARMKDMKLSSSKFSKLDNWGAWSNPVFLPFDYENVDVLTYDEYIHVNRFVPAKYSQVAKDKTKNRSIVVGCPAQISAQRQIDKAIRRVLKMRGIDLETLANYNRLKAYIGSEVGSIDTLDLSSASDHISIGLIAYLCKGSRSTESLFIDLMSTCNAIIDVGHTDNATLLVYSEGVDGMGNPAIFSLESALFTCIIAWGCMFGRPWLYSALDLPRASDKGNLIWRGSVVKWRWFASFGDDQAPPSILPKSFWRQLYSSLYMVMNEDKSFGLDDFGNDVPFRESCGADFSGGNLVRGFYLKNREPTLYDAVRMYNFFTLYYELDDKAFKATPLGKKLRNKVMRLTSGCWANVVLFTTSKFVWENRVPDNFLLFRGLYGTPQKALMWDDGSFHSYQPFWVSDERVEYTAKDLALLACESVEERTVFWYEANRKRFFGYAPLSEKDWLAIENSLSSDLAFGRRCSDADYDDIMDMTKVFN